MGVVDHLGKRPQLGDEVVTLDARAGHLAQLPDNHQRGRTGQVADEQGLRQQVGDHAEAGDPANQTPSADDQAEGGGQRHRPLGVGAGQRCDRRPGHQGDRRLGTHRQHPRRAQHGVDDQRHQRGPQPDHRRHADERRVRHHLRHQVGDHRDPGEHVDSQPAASVPPQHTDPRGRPGDGLEQAAIVPRREVELGRRTTGDPCGTRLLRTLGPDRSPVAHAGTGRGIVVCHGHSINSRTRRQTGDRGELDELTTRLDRPRGVR